MTCIGIKTALTLLSFLPVLAAAANSDLYQVRLKNGDLLSGELKSSSAKELVIHTAYAGDVTIKRSEVQAFSPLRQKNEQSSISSHSRNHATSSRSAGQTMVFAAGFKCCNPCR